jgi:hypothetical protein
MSQLLTLARGELLAWLNDLLGQAPAKVEECGKGAIYCQVGVDSTMLSMIYLHPAVHESRGRRGTSSPSWTELMMQIIDSIYGSSPSLRAACLCDHLWRL